MNLTRLHTKLIAAARQNPPSDAVPYAFEKRIMARISQPVVDMWAVWGHGLWRAALSCAVVTLLLAGWSYSSTSETGDLSEAVENTVYAALDEAGAQDLSEDAR